MTRTSTDAELVERTLGGESTAYADLVRRYRRAALARALAVLGDQFEAEDVAQESFVRAYDELATCQDPARFGAWFLTIVRRSALNRARSIQRRRTVPIDATLPSSRPSAADRLERADVRATLLGALAQLPAVQRDVVLLADLEDWSHAEIAEKTGVSITMSRRHLSDARRKLRVLLASLRSLSG